MLRSLRTTRGRIVVALVASIALVAPWVAFEMSIAILPVLVIPFWIPIFARQEEPVSSRARRLTLASAVVGLFTVTVLVGVLLYVA